MTAEEFVSMTRVVVMQAAVDDTMSIMLDPPGRRPDSELVELANWFRSLAETDRAMVRRALAETSHAAVFGMFAVLDGVRRVDEREPPGELELCYENDGGRTKLNGDLHDILNSEPWR